MLSPPMPLRNIQLLNPEFRSRFLSWLEEAKAVMPEYEIRITETLRTIERQRYLKQRGLTRTMNSRHLTGHAADIALIDRRTRRAVWDAAEYRRLYRLAPLEPHGLRTIDTRGFVDLVHIEQPMTLAN